MRIKKKYHILILIFQIFALFIISTNLFAMNTQANGHLIFLNKKIRSLNGIRIGILYSRWRYQKLTLLGKNLSWEYVKEWKSQYQNAEAQSTFQNRLVQFAIHHWGDKFFHQIINDFKPLNQLQVQGKKLIQCTIDDRKMFDNFMKSKNIKIQKGENVYLLRAISSYPYIFFEINRWPNHQIPKNKIKVTFQYSKEFQIPNSAVIWWKGKPWVFVEMKRHLWKRVSISNAQSRRKSFWSSNAIFHFPIIIQGAEQCLSLELISFHLETVKTGS
jgi:hypothetical protein